MTLVIARQFGDRIIVASDTMITDESSTGPNTIPGRLKAITLSPALSVAYAGMSIQAITAIRKAKDLALVGCELPEIMDILVPVTLDGTTDFIVASHLPNAELRKIRLGKISLPQLSMSIGDQKLVRQVLDLELVAGAARIPWVSKEELKFTRAFSELFRESGIAINEGVGGIPIFLEAVKSGHSYQNHSGVMRWDTIKGGQPQTPEQLSNLINGTNQWKFCVHASRWRGVGVMGISIPDANVGFIHSPLQEDEAIKVDLRPQAGLAEVEKHSFFHALVDAKADTVSGGIIITKVPERKTEVLTSELAAVAKHAANSKCDTKVYLHEEGLWIVCKGTDHASEQLLGFGFADDNFVDHACGVIDDANEYMSKLDVQLAESHRFRAQT